MSTKIKVYAPILIPTLCRFETFVKCVESLAKCTGAEHSELYIALDYPSKDVHWDGYKKIVEYLPTIHGFKHVHITKREQNFGVTKNARELIDRISAQYDRFIFTEDDNVFSPNYLEYINKGLEKYRDDPNVIAICGFNYPFPYMKKIDGYDFNAFPITAYTAWGVARWTNKIPYDFVNSEKAKEIIFSWHTVRKLWKQDMHATIHRLLYRYKNAYSDLMYHLYCIMENKYVIFPAISKVRNLGFEGNATNCRPNPIYANQTIDTELHFELDDFDIKDYPAINAVHKKMFDRSFVVRRLCELEYLMFRLTGNVFRDIPFIRYFQRRNVNTERT